MTRSRVAIYTAITGAYDELREPAVVDPDCDYLCFTDDPHRRSDVWNIQQIAPDHQLSAGRQSRRVKLLAHHYLPTQYDYSIWIDANLDTAPDLVTRMRAELRERDCVFFRHPERECLYDEANLCAQLGKDRRDTLDNQVAAYRDAGMPAQFGLFENSVLMRRHHAAFCRELMERWWAEFARRSCRDQISQPFVMWRMGIAPDALSAPAARGTLYWQRPHRVGRLLGQRSKALQQARTVVLFSHPSVDTFLRALLQRCVRLGAVPEHNAFADGTLLLDPNYMWIYGDCQEPPRILDEHLIAARRLMVLLEDPRETVLRRLSASEDAETLDRVLHSPSQGLERASAYVNALLGSFRRHPGENFLARAEAIYDNADVALAVIEFLLEQPVDRPRMTQAWREARSMVPRQDRAAGARREIDAAIDRLPVTRRLIAELGYPAGTWRAALTRLRLPIGRRLMGKRSSASP